MEVFSPERQCWSILTCRLQEVLMKCGWLNHWAFHFDTTPNSQEEWNTGAKLNISLSEQAPRIHLLWHYFGSVRVILPWQRVQKETDTTPTTAALPDCPGGGTPDAPLGRHRNTVSTAALFPEHGSMAIGLGAPCKRNKPQVNLWDSHSIFICAPLVYLKAQWEGIFS